MTDLVFASAAELSPLLKGRQISPVELVEAHLDRIAALDATLKAYIHLDAGGALRLARQAEAELAKGLWRGPLHGIPVAHKDIIDVAGLPTTAASRVLEGQIASRDSTVAERLREAGAICLGKLNLHEFASGSMEVFGAARNPWNLNYSPGVGSSTGSAVAVAAGLATCALGTDTGGSIRGPAAACGVPGLKPTYGRVSRAGVIPLSWSLDHVGPIARSVADLALVLQVIAGSDSRDRSASPMSVSDYTAVLQQKPRNMRLGLPKDFFLEGCDDEVLGALEQVIVRLQELGYEIVEVNLPNVDLGPAASWALAYSEAFAYHRQNFLERSGDYTTAFLLKITAAGMLTAEERVTAHRIQEAVTHDFTSALHEVRAIIAPVSRRAPVPAGSGAPTSGPRWEDMRSPTRPISVTGLPALVLPCGFSRAGLPLAFQLVGRSWDEQTLFQIGAAWEESQGWRTLRPLCVAFDTLTGEEGTAEKARGPDVAGLEVDDLWVIRMAEQLGLRYVDPDGARQIASMLTPVKSLIDIARQRLDARIEPAVRPAPI
jgi:aspartyl-tRNA(Asn)/glutamyl-tRNA(Gln) amidotransferase subunit A